MASEVRVEDRRRSRVESVDRRKFSRGCTSSVRICFLGTAAILSTLGALGGTVLAHEGALEIRSTAVGAGTLAIGALSSAKLVLTQNACSMGSCLFTNSDVAFMTPNTDLADPPLFALSIATVVRVELVSADAGASVKLGTTVLDVPGESAQLGVSWSMHAHPVFQVTAPQLQPGLWSVTLRLTTASKNYASSSPMTFVVTNLPTTTTVTMASTTTTLAASCGDGTVSDGEDCDPGAGGWAVGRACNDQCRLLACGDADGDGKRGTSDALYVLRVATGSRNCDACLCNVDASNGTSSVGVSDALKLLRFAVGIASAVLQCPVCN